MCSFVSDPAGGSEEHVFGTKRFKSLGISVGQAFKRMLILPCHSLISTYKNRIRMTFGHNSAAEIRLSSSFGDY